MCVSASKNLCGYQVQNRDHSQKLWSMPLPWDPVWENSAQQASEARDSPAGVVSRRPLHMVSHGRSRYGATGGRYGGRIWGHSGCGDGLASPCCAAGLFTCCCCCFFFFIAAKTLLQRAALRPLADWWRVSSAGVVWDGPPKAPCLVIFITHQPEPDSPRKNFFSPAPPPPQVPSSVLYLWKLIKPTDAKVAFLPKSKYLIFSAWSCRGNSQGQILSGCFALRCLWWALSKTSFSVFLILFPSVVGA